MAKAQCCACEDAADRSIESSVRQRTCGRGNDMQERGRVSCMVDEERACWAVLRDAHEFSSERKASSYNESNRGGAQGGPTVVQGLNEGEGGRMLLWHVL